MTSQLPNVKAMYQDASAGLGGTLTCEVCRRSQQCSERDAAGFLARGWPTCCGHTMSLNAAAPDQPRAAPECPSSPTGRHEDDGGMFFFKCRHCGLAEEFGGGT